MANQNGAMSDAIQRLITPVEPVEPTAVDEEVTELEVEQTEEEEAETVQAEVSEETSEDDTEPLYEVSIGGEKREVTLEDLRKGYMMESDYRRKTQEVASQRKELDERFGSLDGKIQDAEDVVKLELEDMKSPEALELKEYDPTAYYEKRDKVEAKAKKLESLTTERKDRAIKANNEHIAEESKLIPTAIPEWLDEEVAAKETALVQKMWNDLDLIDNPPRSMADHRHVVAYRKAALYDQIMATKPEDKLINEKPKSAEPGSVTTKEEKTTQRRKDTRMKLKETGKMSDAVKALLET